MRVADVMQKDVVTVREDATVGEVVAILADAHVSGAPVVNRNGTLIGAISATDLLVAEAEHDSELLGVISRSDAARVLAQAR